MSCVVWPNGRFPPRRRQRAVRRSGCDASQTPGYSRMLISSPRTRSTTTSTSAPPRSSPTGRATGMTRDKRSYRSRCWTVSTTSSRTAPDGSSPISSNRTGPTSPCWTARIPRLRRPRPVARRGIGRPDRVGPGCPGQRPDRRLARRDGLPVVDPQRLEHPRTVPRCVDGPRSLIVVTVSHYRIDRTPSCGRTDKQLQQSL